ncbi:unnamed protein product [Microthlaspi erraticum]|uniref:DYW domain-containing protein n=1 Tax=Microthlaspi erraticum TaxID=1685480 RepID=A0A6D2JKT8_9BRAS|nr:unnamed protein product [Microthlaspi erraticum]
MMITAYVERGLMFEARQVRHGLGAGALEEFEKMMECGYKPDQVAAEGISRLRREHPAAYHVLCRVHGEKGDWTCVMELRRLMKITKVRKQDAK